jgi:hypothetical protein
MMTTGDQNDILQRLKATLPRWFSDSTPVLDAVLSGWAQAWSFIYSLYAYAKLQSRVLTATDGWLDMIAGDFFGVSVLRKANQSDTSFRAMIIANMFRERGTRNAIVRVLTDLTGRSPTIIEPQRPADTGALGVSLGLSVGGAIGSLLLPAQTFVVAYRPLTSGIPYVPGLGTAPFGLGITQGGAVLVSLSQIQNSVSDADIYAAIDSVKAAGTVIWTRIQTNKVESVDMLDSTFVLDTSQLL